MYRAFILILLDVGSCWLGAQPSIPSQRVAFKPGASSTTVQGSGDHDYVLGAKAGQTMSVKLTTKSTMVNFNVLPPGSDVAIANTSITGEQKWSGKLPATGDYTVRVYVMRAAARRGSRPPYRVTFTITGASDH